MSKTKFGEVKIDMTKITSIASAAMLGSLNISVWEGRKKDKQTEAEVQESKGARSARAASVHKHLFAECPALESIKSLRGEARQYFNRVTMPWNDGGQRIVPTKTYFELIADMNNYQVRFNDLREKFFSIYTTEISKQAYSLGAMFNVAEYPTLDELREKFRFDFSVDPMPMAGDFRLDIGTQAQEDIRAQFERVLEERIKEAMSEPWQRVKRKVEHIIERMDAVLAHDPDAYDEEPVFARVAVGTEQVPIVEDDGTISSYETREVFETKQIDIKRTKKRRPKLHDTMLDDGMELCGLLDSLNITNDPALEEARKNLQSALVHVDMGSLKTVPEMQQKLRNDMQDILDKFGM